MDQRSGCNAISAFVLDDEPSFRTSLADLLRDDDYDVSAAVS